MKVGYLLVRHYGLKKNIPDPGSSFVRGDWIIKYWHEAEVFDDTKDVNFYDVLVLQKVYEDGFLKGFRGLSIYDCCDPKGKFDKRMSSRCDVVTAPGEDVLEPFFSWRKDGAYVVPDRHDLSYYPRRKVHQPGKPLWVAWMGYDSNFDAFELLAKPAKRLGLKVKCISNRHNFLADRSVIYDRKTVNDHILSCDIYLDPRLGWKNPPEKSLKTQAARIMNLPVANTEDELVELSQSYGHERNVIKDVDFHSLDIRRTVEQLKEIIDRHG